MQLKTLIAMVVLGSTSIAGVAAADTVFQGRAEIYIGKQRPTPRPAYYPKAPAVLVRDHRVNQRDSNYNEYEDKFDSRRHVKLTLDLTGEYSGTFGTVILNQRGKRVWGSYAAGGGGVIDGRIQRNGTVQYTWQNDNGGVRGEGVWFLNRRNNRIEGTWGTGASHTDGGAWNLVRQR